MENTNPYRVEAGNGFFVAGNFRYEFKLNEHGEHFDFTATPILTSK